MSGFSSKYTGRRERQVRSRLDLWAKLVRQHRKVRFKSGKLPNQSYRSEMGAKMSMLVAEVPQWNGERA